MNRNNYQKPYDTVQMSFGIFRRRLVDATAQVALGFEGWEQAMPYRFSRPTQSQVLARARADFKHETGKSWDDVFSGSDVVSIGDEDKFKHRAAPYIMKASRDLSEEFEAGSTPTLAEDGLEEDEAERLAVRVRVARSLR